MILKIERAYFWVFFLIVFVFNFIEAATQIPKKITLETSWQYAEKNIALVKEKEHLSDILSLRIKNIQSLWLPGTEVFAQASYLSDVITIDPGIAIPGLTFPVPERDQYKLGIELQQLIFDGGAINARKNIITTDLKAQQAGLEVNIYKIRETVTELYFGILINRENLRLLKLFLDELMQRIEVAESGVRNGAIPESNLWQLEIETLKLQQRITGLDYLNKRLIGNLSELLAIELNPDIELEVPAFYADFHKTGKRKEFEWFRLLQLNIDETANLAAASRFPVISAFAQAGYGRPGLNMLSNEFETFYIIGLRLGWTITDWNQTKRNKQIVGLQKQIIDSRREAFEKSQRISMNNKLYEVAQLQEIIKEDKRIIELYEKLLLITSSQLDQGVIRPADYLNEFNALLEAKIKSEIHEKQLIKAQINFIIEAGGELSSDEN